MGSDDLENLGDLTQAGSAQVGRHLATVMDAGTDELAEPLRGIGELPEGALPRHRDPHAIESLSPVVPQPRHRASTHADS